MREAIKLDVNGKKRAATLCRFDGMGGLADYLDAMPEGFRHDHGAHFAGCDLPTAITRCRSGNPDLVAASDKMLDKLEALSPMTNAWETQRAIVGGVPSVPDFLSGNPLNMRLRRRVESQQAPIAVLIDVTVSADIPFETILRRGAAILALVRALSAKRPVSLHVVAGLQEKSSNVAIAIRVDTAPLDLARAAWLLGAPEVLRQVFFNVLHSVSEQPGRYIPWIFGDHGWSQKNLGPSLLPFIGAEKHITTPGIVSGGAFSSDADAAAWVAKAVKDNADE
jgi:hypothetical protein